MRRLAVLVILAALAGCGSSPKTPVAVKPAPPAPLDPWILTTLDNQGGEPAYLSNGLIGVRIGRNGGGLDPTGKPLGFYMIDEYVPKGEEKIRTMPSPIMVAWAVGNKLYNGEKNYDFVKSGGTPLDPRGGTNYRQTLDMHTGVLTTRWDQEGVTIQCDTLVHPTERALGQHWTLKATKDTTFSIRTLDYSGPTDPQKAKGGDQDAGVAITVSPRRVVTMGWQQSGGTANANVEVGGFRVQEGSVKAGETVTFDRTLSFGLLAAKPLPADDDPAKHADVLEKATPRPFGYSQILADATVAWKKRWTSDIEIDGPVEDQQAVRSFLFYLRSSIAPGARRAIAPMALSSDIYGGHVFWDADIWVLPALMLTDPDLAKEIGDYRLARLGQAGANFDNWIKNERPTANGKLGFVTIGGLLLGSKYPWESSVTGLETVPGPSKFEDHITGSVLWGLSQLESLGINPSGPDVRTTNGRAVGPAILAFEAASFYNQRSISGTNGREIRGTVSPDENHTGDNDLYTNLLAMWASSSRKWPATPTYKLPKDDKSFLTYDNDQGKGYKQAAALLACYPLQYPPAEAQTKVMLERFAPNVIKNGPAMTDSIHGLLYARIGEPQKGYDEWRKGWVDFTRHPLLMFSEKRNSPRTYFATGAGGSLQTVLFGFAGLRLDYKKAADAAWSHSLAGGKMLSVKPSLPPSWKRVRLRGISLPDGRYDITIEPGKVSAVKEAQR